MAGGNNQEVGPLLESIPDGHRVTYNLRFHYLDNMNNPLAPITCNIGCQTTPTSWRIELTCEQMPEGNYILTIRIRRMDRSTNIVKVTFLGSFFDASGIAVVHPIISGKGIPPDDGLENTLYNLPLEFIRFIATVRVAIEIKNCHSGTNWQCLSKFGTPKNSVNQNSRL